MRSWATCVVLAWAAAAHGEPLPTSAAHQVVHVPAPADPVRGPRFAPVTIDLYLAFGPPASSVAWETVRRAVERNPDVREVVHLTSYSTPGSDLALEAAMAAESAGRFLPFCDRLLRDRTPPILTIPELVRAGVDVGLDGRTLETALEQHTYRSAVDELRVRARGHIPGEVYVNHERLWANEDTLATAILNARPRAQALLESGVPLSRLYERLADDKQKRQADTTEPHAPSRRPVDVTGAPARGPSFAPVTLVVFSNLSCAQCAELEQLVQRVRDKHPGAIREVWKNWVPIYNSFGPESIAAEFSVAAQNQGRFWELHDLALPPRLAAPRPRPGRIELEQMARTVGIDLQRMADERRTGALRAGLERDLGEQRRLGLNYSPNILVNGVLFTGNWSEARLEQLLAEELARGVLERLSPP